MTELGFTFLWVKAFALTSCVELLVAVPLLAKTGAPLWQRCAVVVIAQFATHPIVWFVIPALHLPRAGFVVLAELWAVLAEAIVYRTSVPSISFVRALIASGAANAASMLAGLAARAAFAQSGGA